MAKLDRDQLKMLIKECLVEILTEGASHPISESAQVRHPAPTPARSAKAPERRRTAADMVTFGAPQQKQALDKTFKDTAQMLTANPVLQSVFEDTARTTLQEQLNNAAESPMSIAGLDDEPIVTREEESINNAYTMLAFSAPRKNRNLVG